MPVATNRRTNAAFLLAALVVALIAAVFHALDGHAKSDYVSRCLAAGGEVLFDGSERIVGCIKPGSLIDLQ